MEIGRIPIILKRYQFAEKMRICQILSRRVMSVSGTGLENINGKVLPWEVEFIALISLTSNGEYAYKNFDTREGNRELIRIINCIRDYIHPHLKDQEKFEKYFTILFGLTQFGIQENIFIKYYRYKYIFSYKNSEINMEEQFRVIFNVDYLRLLKFGFVMNFMLSIQSMSQRILDYLINKYNDVFKLLHITRDEFINIQKFSVNEIEDYIYGFKYFSQYPFIEYEKIIYLPTPHLIVYAITTSMYYRITDRNTDLRMKMGKEVLENYLAHIFDFDNNKLQSCNEYKYKIGRQEKRTVDFMLKYDSGYILIDSKSFAPAVRIRNLDDDAINKTIEIISSSIVQVYKHVVKRFYAEYFPFDNDDYEIENTFGIVLLLEDCYIRRDKLYKKSAEKLNLSIDSEEFKFLCSNIKVFSLYEIENIVFHSLNLLELLKIQRDDKNKWMNLTIYNEIGSDKSSNVFIKNIINEVNADYTKEINELVEKGLIDKS